MHPLVSRGDNASARRRWSSIPGGDEAACGLDDRDESDDIIGFQSDLDDEVDAASRQQAIAVAIPAKPRHEHARFQSLEAAALRAGGKVVRMGRGEYRLGKPGTGTR